MQQSILVSVRKHCGKKLFSKKVLKLLVICGVVLRPWKFQKKTKAQNLIKMKIDASETGLPINTNNLQNGYISNMNKKYD